MDLRDADFSSETIALDGEWQLLWNEFVPADSAAWDGPDVLAASVPGTWNDVLLNGEPLPDTGFCSMQLSIQLPPGTDKAGIKVNNVGTSYKLFEGNELLIENGRPGRNRADTSANYQPRAAYFEPDGETVVLTMHIANFHDRVGGVWTSMFIGSAEGISKKHYTDGSFDMLLFGMFVIISLYFLISWYFGGRKPAFLWFALASLMIAIRTLTAGEIYLMSIFPGMGFEWNQRIQLASQPALVAFFLLSLKNVFPDEISSRVVKIIISLIAAYAVVVLTVPLIIHTYLLFPFQVIIIITGLYLVCRVFRAFRCRRTGSTILFIGLVVLLLATINDILYSVTLISTGYLVTFGIILFSISYIITLTRHAATKQVFGDKTDTASIMSAMYDRGISKREGDVLQLLLRGHPYEEIGEMLYIAKSTVTKHVHSIYKKLEVKNRVGLYEFVKSLP